MVWSGFTKYLWHTIFTRGKAVDIQNFGVVGPQYEEWWDKGLNPLDKGFQNKNLL